MNIFLNIIYILMQLIYHMIELTNNYCLWRYYVRVKNNKKRRIQSEDANQKKNYQLKFDNLLFEA